MHGDFSYLSALAVLILTLLNPLDQDFPGDHPDIELLRLRNYTIGKKLADDEVLGPQGLERIAGLLGCLAPFVSRTWHAFVVVLHQSPFICPSRLNLPHPFASAALGLSAAKCLFIRRAQPVFLGTVIFGCARDPMLAFSSQPSVLTCPSRLRISTAL